jgi:hypothetical protein
VARARRAHAFRDAELAAIDLAERLADPMSSVAGGGRPGVESGGGGGGGSGSPDEGEASEAGEASERSGAELDDLLKRHKDELDRVEQALDGAATQEERDALRELAKRSAEAIREAARDLPQDGAPGTSAERLGEARRRAESTAGELERGEIGPALREGREAVEALRDAAKRAAEEGDSRGESAARRAANRAEEALDALDEARKKNDRAAEERAKDALREAAKNEGRMAERARDLEKGGRDGDGALPEDTLEKLRAAEEAMREAERLLDEGKGEEGREKQREAQRLLELARGDADDEGRDDAPSDAEGSDGKRMAQETDVPKKDAHKKPEDFRKRVLEGLARPGDARLKEALRRYAEGLLQ